MTAAVLCTIAAAMATVAATVAYVADPNFVNELTGAGGVVATLGGIAWIVAAAIGVRQG
jgi:hypothetical protein